MYQQHKRYNTATVGSATSNLALHRNQSGKGLASLGRPQVAMHSQLPRFLVLTFFFSSLCSSKLWQLLLTVNTFHSFPKFSNYGPFSFYPFLIHVHESRVKRSKINGVHLSVCLSTQQNERLLSRNWYNLVWICITLNSDFVNTGNTTLIIDLCQIDCSSQVCARLYMVRWKSTFS